MKHTPGPWKVKINGIDIIAVGDTEETSPLARVNLAWSDIDTAKANARLIAAAPELLKACRVAIETFDDDAPGAGDTEKGALRRLRAAVSRAEGQPGGQARQRKQK